MLLAAASTDRRWARGPVVAAVAAAVYALHPLAVRQSLTAFDAGEGPVAGPDSHNPEADGRRSSTATATSTAASTAADA